MENRKMKLSIIGQDKEINISIDEDVDIYSENECSENYQVNVYSDLHILPKKKESVRDIQCQDGKILWAALARMQVGLHLFGVSNIADNGLGASAMRRELDLKKLHCLPY